MALPSFLSNHQPRLNGAARARPAEMDRPDRSGTATSRFARFIGAGEGAQGPEAEFALPHVLQFSGIIGGAWRTYYHGQYDEAMRFSQEDALAMRNDAWLMSLLNERKRSVATLKWHIEVDNPRDPVQKALADGLTQLYKNLPRQTDLAWSGLEAIWFGRSADQFVWRYKNVQVPAMPRLAAAPGVPASMVASEGEFEQRRVLCMQNHLPIEGDKIDYDFDGVPYVLVSPIVALNTYQSAGADLRSFRDGKWRSDQDPPEPMTPDLKAKHASLGFTTIGGKALFLKGSWRSRFRIHTHEAIDSSYWQPWKAGSLHGVGIRSVIFWYWWLRQEYLANVTDWAARTGLGIKLWYYEQGNAASKRQILQAAKESTQQVNIAVPYDPSQPNRPAVDIVEMAGTGADLLITIVKHVEEYIERYVVGQNMTGGSDDFSAGFGDRGRADLASRTNWQITKLDARKFDDTNTTDVLDVIKRYSYPEYAEIPTRLVSEVDDPDIKKAAEGMKVFVEMGGEVIEDEAREKLGGLSKPRSTDKTIGGLKALQAQQATSGHVAPPGGMGRPNGKPGANGKPGQEASPADNSMWRLGETDQPVRYAEGTKSEPKYEMLDGQKGRWVTMGAVNGRGGSHVFLSDKGKILKGNRRLMGHSFHHGSLSFGPEAGHHAEMESAAQAQGIDPQDLHGLAGQYLEHDLENKQDVMTMLRDAKRRLPGIMRADPAGDYDKIPGFDDFAQTISEEYPHLFKGGWQPDVPDTVDFPAMLWDYIQAARSGEYRPMSHQEAYDAALGHLLENKGMSAAEAEAGGGGDVGTFDPSEFETPEAKPVQSANLQTETAPQPAQSAPKTLSPQEQEAKISAHLSTAMSMANTAEDRYPGVQFDFHGAAVDALMNAAKNYDPAMGPFENWANKAIAKRLHPRKQGKSVKATQGLVDKEGQNIDVETPRPAPEPKGPQMAEVDEAMATLPEQTRRILEERKQGKEFADIATLLGMEPNAVRTRATRAYKTLREMIPHSFELIAHLFDEKWLYEYGPRHHPEASVKGAVLRVRALKEHHIDGEVLDAELDSIAREFTADELRQIAEQCEVKAASTKWETLANLREYVDARLPLEREHERVEKHAEEALYQEYRAMIEVLL